MARKLSPNRLLNAINLFISILVFATGLVLLLQFHVGHGAYHNEWLGLGKEFWLNIHRASAVGFFLGFAAHVQRHWRFIKTLAGRWRVNLSQKTKSATRLQVLLLITGLVVMWAAFYAWVAMPGATLEHEPYHDWIDVHARVGLFFLIGMGVHIQRRWSRIF